MTWVALDSYGLLPEISLEVDVTNDPTNPVRVWTDITTKARKIVYARSGRNDELQRTETGTFTALCDNRGDAITALGIRKAQWIRLRARWLGVTYPIWQGIFESLPRQWPSAGKDAIVSLTAADALKVFRLYDLAGQTFGAQRNDQRVAALAALAGIATSSIDTDTDAADAIVDPISEGSEALSMLLTIEESENGLVIAEADGTLSFQGRHWRLLHSTSALATFGETPGTIPYRDTATLEDDDTKLANIVAVTPAGGSAVVVSDAPMQGRYFVRRLNRSLITSSAAVATDAANYLLARYKDPSPRIPAIDIPLVVVASPLKAVLLAAGNSSRFAWTRAAATPISEDVFVEHVSGSITPGEGWGMRFQLSPAADQSGWVLGDAVNGVLGSTTALVY